MHGEFRFSHQAMPQPMNSEETGGRLSGEDMRKYMESFAERFLRGRIRYNMDVLRISRHAPTKNATGKVKAAKGWTIEVMDRKTQSQFQLDYDKVVLCSGVCCLSLVVRTIYSSQCFAITGLQRTVRPPNPYRECSAGSRLYRACLPLCTPPQKYGSTPFRCKTRLGSRCRTGHRRWRR